MFPGRNPIVIYLARLGGERCNRLYTFSRPIGAVEDLMNLNLGFGHAGNQFQDIEIYSDEEDPMDFVLAVAAPQALAFGGYAFKEDYFVVDNGSMEGPVVLPVHEVEMVDFITGAGYNFRNKLCFSFILVWSASLKKQGLIKFYLSVPSRL